MLNSDENSSRLMVADVRAAVALLRNQNFSPSNTYVVTANDIVERIGVEEALQHIEGFVSLAGPRMGDTD